MYIYFSIQDLRNLKKIIHKVSQIFLWSSMVLEILKFLQGGIFILSIKNISTVPRGCVKN